MCMIVCVYVYVSQYVVQLKMFVPPSFSYKECSRNKVMEIENGNESILELSAHLDNELSVNTCSGAQHLGARIISHRRINFGQT